ncbi:MAG TPA: spermine synthase [Anaerolineae bacterium]|nr:spermine synthase [Anaerolineae bacterium]HRJ75260.1 fused MFS/spermidine synthase [Anaerolineales bacterium]
MKRYILLTVFISGMTTLAAELTAGRLIGNVFGTSNLVWASIIGLMLIYLTFGYFLGGKWADANPSPQAMYRILAWAAFTVGLVPYVAVPVLTFAADAFEVLSVGIMAGSFIVVLVLFIVPITLLGTISPYAIRLSIEDTDKSGQISGQIYAISTLGSFIGTFIPTLITIPTIGTRLTFASFGMLLLIVALIGLYRFVSQKEMLKYIWMPIALLIIAIVFSNSALKNSTGQVYETESAYNYIQVQQQNGFTLLRLNDGQGVHSIYHPDTMYFNGPWEQFSVGPYFYANRSPDDVQSMAIIGLAAGTAARQATAIYGEDIQIDGIEIDDKIVQVGRDYFDMNFPNLNVIVGDGRLGLDRSNKLYDIIAIDAYRPPYIPAHMTTLEFFTICASHLTDTGVLTLNVGSTPGDRRLIDGLATTMSQIFPSIHIMDIPGTLNTMIFATKQPTLPENFSANLVRLAGDPNTNPLLITTMSSTFTNLQDGYSTTTVFTDDLAPIEWIVNNMVVSFVLQGGLEFLQ